MITEKDLLAAIAECESEPLTEKKVDRLATYYVIYDHLFGKTFHEDVGYSNKSEVENTISVNGDTEFLKIINGKNTEKAIKILNELVDAIKVLHPKMYDNMIDKLSDI